MPCAFSLANFRYTAEQRKTMFANIDDAKTGWATLRKILERLASHGATVVATASAEQGLAAMFGDKVRICRTSCQPMR